MKRFSLKYQLLALTALALFVWGAAIELPFTFRAGDVISAEQMNQTLQALNEGKQERVSGTCAAGSSIRAIGADGTVTCHTDQIGTGGSAGVSALNGMTGAVTLQAGDNVTIDDSTAGQLRISSSGGPAYQADGSSLNLAGTTFSVRAGGVTETHLADGAVSGTKLAMPLQLSGNTTSVAARITNANAAGMGLRVDVGSQPNTFANAALMGQAAGTGATGVHGTSGTGIGVWGRSDARGVVGTLGAVSCAGTYGVGGCAESGTGVHGTSSTGIGVWGKSDTRGVVGSLGAVSCPGSYGVGGCAENSLGVFGQSAGNHGVLGRTTSAGAAGVLGEVTGTTLAYGVRGSSNSGIGVAGESVSNVGVFGRSTSNNAAFFTGGSGGTGSCSYNGGAGWNCTSDMNAKENFADADALAILSRLAAMPISTWTMKGDVAQIPHLGPTAQDFHAAFGLGGSDLTINSADAQGVALAAIQGLYQVVLAQQAQIEALEARLAGFE